MDPIKSKSGRSKDVRRMYHRDSRRADGTRIPMKAWARVVAEADPVLSTTINVLLVCEWRASKRAA